MKFTCTIDINRPQAEVAELFANPDHLKEYQKGFISKELLEGTAGQNDAISKILFKQGKGTMELTETIVNNSLPLEFEAHYHHKHMDNTMKSKFISLSDNQTRYVTEVEYTALRGFFPKIIAFLFPRMFKKQVQKWLENFKSFAERQ